jgi:3-hydroxyacyl-[acyl-carrier-protein] dehydratase
MEDILAVLPHRPPFLFVDRVTVLEPFKRLVAERELRADEPHFAGHFPGRAIMPGVLITDALAQASGLLIGLSQKESRAQPVGRAFFLGAANMKYPAPAFPGEVLTLTAMADGSSGRLFRFTVEAAVGRKLVARGQLTLAMGEEGE